MGRNRVQHKRAGRDGNPVPAFVPERPLDRLVEHLAGWGNRQAERLVGEFGLDPFLNPSARREEGEADRIAAKAASGSGEAGLASEVSAGSRSPSEAGGEGVPAQAASGEPLAAEQRRYFEKRFGADLSGVRIHRDSRAARLADAADANALTVGNAIYFARGAYRPGSPSGKALLAHELVHVVQQAKAARRGSSRRALQLRRDPRGKGRRIPIKIRVSGCRRGAGGITCGIKPLAQGALYKAQLRQLHIAIGKRARTRAVSNWALKFFAGKPTIDTVARSLTKKIDQSLYAINNIREHLQSLSIIDLSNFVYRWKIDYMTKVLLGAGNTPWLINYRIPRALAVALISVEEVRGKCEEHAFLGLYLLTVGHMIQNKSYGRLANDIYYTGAATSKHGFIILVLGKEFKNAVAASKKLRGKIDPKWLMAHKNLWGKNAWVADGWTGKAKKLSADASKLDYTMIQTYRRDPDSKRTSEWDLTVLQMAERVAKDYGI